MPSQETIFDDSFNPPPFKRRSLLTTPIRIYLLLWIIMGTIGTGASLIILRQNSTVTAWLGWIWTTGCFTLLPFIMAATLWFETRWGIWVNLGGCAVWIVNIILLMMWMTGPVSLLALIIIIPYMVLLLRIRKRW